MKAFAYNTVQVGDTFGDWTIAGSPFRKGRGEVFFPCTCKCGVAVEVQGRRLVNGTATMCVRCGNARPHSRMHGESQTRLARIWKGMIDRCYLPSNTAFKSYGKVGVTVCRTWHIYDAFKAWAISNGYEDNLTIDRIDNSLGYSPDNCRWATVTEQSRNRGSNRYLTAFGQRMTVAEWAEDPRCSVTRDSLYARLKYNWNEEEAITKPLQRIKRMSANA